MENQKQRGKLKTKEEKNGKIRNNENRKQQVKFGTIDKIRNNENQKQQRKLETTTKIRNNKENWKQGNQKQQRLGATRKLDPSPDALGRKLETIMENQTQSKLKTKEIRTPRRRRWGGNLETTRKFRNGENWK